MIRISCSSFFAIATILLLSAPTSADDSAAIKREIEQLQKDIKALESEDAAAMDAEIEGYLDTHDGYASAQGDDGMDRISITTAILANSQNTIGHDPQNRSLVSGSVFLDFKFEVTENLHIFTDLIASTAASTRLPAGFPLDTGGFGPPSTFAGQDDGIGVDGTQPIRPTGGVNVASAGFLWMTKIGEMTLHTEAGLLDPRERFLQNKFMNDENTQFMHNEFDDLSSISWATTAAGNNVLGIHMWLSFGENDMFTVRAGFFNAPGRFFDRGQLYIEFGWTAEVNGREMNIKGMVVLDSFTSGTEDDVQYGVSWDWQFSDRFGFFARLGGNTEDVATVEQSFTLGVVM